MPTYRYRCNECCEEFERRRRISDRDDPTDCPNCGSGTSDRLLGQFNLGSQSSGGNSG